MTIADIETALASVSGINAVFDDGLKTELIGRRNTHLMPFIQYEVTDDLAEHDSDSRIRRTTLNGEIWALHHRDSPENLRTALVATFSDHDQDQMALSIQPARKEAGGRFVVIQFAVQTFSPQAKT